MICCNSFNLLADKAAAAAAAAAVTVAGNGGGGCDNCCESCGGNGGIDWLIAAATTDADDDEAEDADADPDVDDVKLEDGVCCIEKGGLTGVVGNVGGADAVGGGRINIEVEVGGGGAIGGLINCSFSFPPPEAIVSLTLAANVCETTVVVVMVLVDGITLVLLLQALTRPMPTILGPVPPLPPPPLTFPFNDVAAAVLFDEDIMIAFVYDMVVFVFGIESGVLDDEAVAAAAAAAAAADAGVPADDATVVVIITWFGLRSTAQTKEQNKM